MGIATVVLVLGTLVVCIRHGLRGKTGSTPTRAAPEDPYRDVGVKEKSGAPPLIVPFGFKSGDNGVEFACPRCAMKWWQKRPDFCMGCSSCEMPHFHMSCDQKSKENGCGATWIMLAKDAPIVTPPPKPAVARDSDGTEYVAVTPSKLS